jgi:predicted lipoprotein with Yx(FWY)xxD motif
MDKKVIIGAMVLLLLVIVAAGAYFLMGTKSSATSSSTTVTVSTTVPAYTTVQGSTTALTSATTTINTNATVYTVNLESNAAVGEYLTNSTGFTLYTYDNDVPNSGASACYSSCAVNWPPFYAASLSVPSGLNMSDFGTITRTGGEMQLTYKGHPLYLFIGDHNAGGITGQGVGGFKVATK